MLFDCSDYWSWFCLYSHALLSTPSVPIYFLILIICRGQLSACSSRLCRVRPLWVLCTQPFPIFLKEAVSRTWTRDPIVTITRQQLTVAPSLPFNSHYLFMWTDGQKCWWWAMMICFSESMPLSNRGSCGYQMLADPLLSWSLCNHSL
jgi:hypothetical protein